MLSDRLSPCHEASVINGQGQYVLPARRVDLFQFGRMIESLWGDAVRQAADLNYKLGRFGASSLLAKRERQENTKFISRWRRRWIMDSGPETAA